MYLCRGRKAILFATAWYLVRLYQYLAVLLLICPETVYFSISTKASTHPYSYTSTIA